MRFVDAMLKSNASNFGLVCIIPPKLHQNHEQVWPSELVVSSRNGVVVTDNFLPWWHTATWSRKFRFKLTGKNKINFLMTLWLALCVPNDCVCCIDPWNCSGLIFLHQGFACRNPLHVVIVMTRVNKSPPKKPQNPFCVPTTKAR